MSKLRKVSRKTAEYTLHYLMIAKDFWIVDTGQNNIIELQEVLDTLFNSCDNCYTAEVTVLQSTSRLNIKCNVCNCNLSSYDPFISHDKGRSHKKAVQQALSKDNASLQNLLGPITFKSWNEIENNFEPGTFEDELFSTSHIVLGWQFVYREIIDDKQLFTCQLCRKVDNCYKMTQEKAFRHMISDNHILQYMQVKFDKRGSFDGLYEDIKEVQEMEGKLQCKIITFKPRMENKHFSSCSSRRGSSRDRSPSKSRDETRSKRSSDRSSSRSHDSRSRTRSKTPERARRHSPRPKTPPSPKMDDKGTQMDLEPQTMEEFMQDVARHFDHIAKTGDYLTEELKNDIDGQDLLIQVIKVLSQKLYIYSMEHDRHLENDAKSLLKKTESLRLLLPDS